MISFAPEQRFIVTGASSGIGEAVALLLNELGASVIGIGRNRERLEAMKAKAKHPENIFLEQKDLTEDIEGLPAYVKTLKDKYGKFSGMAYCAGVPGLLPEMMMTYNYAIKIFNINYFAPLLFTKGIADKRNNVGEGTSLVYISSIDAKLNDKGQCVYGGSKSALSASIKSISKEYSPKGIRLNTLLPSLIKTPMTEGAMNEGYQTGVIEDYPFGFGEPVDVANFVAFLLSDKSKFISGQNYIVDSGGVL